MNNPDVNPRTNRYIKPLGGVYNSLKKECGIPNQNARSKQSIDCFKWHENPLVNPFTFNNIKRYGKVYLKLEKKCGPPPQFGPSRSRTRSMVSVKRNPLKGPTRLDCLEWLDDKTVNPLTTRRIQKGGKVYLELEKKCKPFV